MSTAKQNITVLLVVAGLMMLAGQAGADPVTTSWDTQVITTDPSNPSVDLEITVEFSYTALSDDAATINVRIFNTSGYDGVSITGFGFNAPEYEAGDAVFGVIEQTAFSYSISSLDPGPTHDATTIHEFNGGISYNNSRLFKLAPYGSFDVGSGTGHADADGLPKLLGGKPQLGIHTGEMGEFTFDIVLASDLPADSGISLMDYNALDYINLYSEVPPGPTPARFIIRWQDTVGDLSGKLVVTPEPASMILFGTAITGVVAATARKRRKNA